MTDSSKNDSGNTTPGAPGTPESHGTGDDQNVTNEQNQATEPLAATPGEDAPTVEAPSVEAPTAHTLPYRTGPTPAHFVSEANPTQSATPGSEWAEMGHDSYATQNQGGSPAGQYAQSGQYAQAPGQYGPAAQSPYGTGPVPPAFQNPKRRPKRWMTIAGAAAAGVIIAGAAGGGAYAIGHSTGEKAADAAGQSQTLQLPGGSSGSGSSGSDSSGGFGAYGFGQGNGTDGSSGSDGSSGTGTTPSDATSASATEKQGVVTIVSTLDYNESSKSAGTGMVMTSDGEILTNNHVVQGATSIQVTVVSTGKTYTAKVVGTDATNDVAVLKLEDASGLQTVSFGENDTVSAGDTVHSTGNAEGTGSLVTAKGTVLATDQSITVQSESGSGTESLKNLIEVSADVVSGDSGGPLRNADGDVIGIITAASSGTSDTTGYAIPISSALSIASNILDGNESGTIQIGLPAFLGAQISSTGTGSGTGTGTDGGTGTGTTGSGVTIAGTVSGSAAAKAGLVAGDTITAIDSKSVTDADSLTSTIQSYNPGDSVKVTYTDANGASKTVTVTLGEGPAA